MQATLIVFFGAGLGGALRHGVNVACARVLGLAFPWGTLAINVAGSLAMGLVVGWLATRLDAGWSQSLRLFLTTGILGGFTTFSAFSLDAVTLWQRGESGAALAYVGGSVVAAIGALALGLAAMRSLA